MNNSQELQIEVIDNRLVISIGISTLAFAVAHSPDLQVHNQDREDFDSPVVIDEEVWARDVCAALQRETLHGDMTLIQFAFDAAFNDAIEMASDGIRLPGDV